MIIELCQEVYHQAGASQLYKKNWIPTSNYNQRLICSCPTGQFSVRDLKFMDDDQRVGCESKVSTEWDAQSSHDEIRCMLSSWGNWMQEKVMQE